jgi:hypothetical protein
MVQLGKSSYLPVLHGSVISSRVVMTSRFLAGGQKTSQHIEEREGVLENLALECESRHLACAFFHFQLLALWLLLFDLLVLSLHQLQLGIAGKDVRLCAGVGAAAPASTQYAAKLRILYIAPFSSKSHHTRNDYHMGMRIDRNSPCMNFWILDDRGQI